MLPSPMLPCRPAPAAPWSAPACGRRDGGSGGGGWIAGASRRLLRRRRRSTCSASDRGGTGGGRLTASATRPVRPVAGAVAQAVAHAQEPRLVTRRSAARACVLGRSGECVLEVWSRASAHGLPDRAAWPAVAVAGPRKAHTQPLSLWRRPCVQRCRLRGCHGPYGRLRRYRRDAMGRRGPLRRPLGAFADPMGGPVHPTTWAASPTPSAVPPTHLAAWPTPREVSLTPRAAPPTSWAAAPAPPSPDTAPRKAGRLVPYPQRNHTVKG